MDAIDPLKSMPLQGLPATEEVQLQVKQKVKQAKMETADTTAVTADDDVSFSPEAARLSRPQFEAFLEEARDEILNMDRNSKNFLGDATQKLVSTAFEKKFGERVLRDPGYPQMEAKVTSIILNDPESRSMIEDLIALIDLDSQHNG